MYQAKSIHSEMNMMHFPTKLFRFDIPVHGKGSGRHEEILIKSLAYFPIQFLPTIFTCDRRVKLDQGDILESKMFGIDF